MSFPSLLHFINIKFVCWPCGQFAYCEFANLSSQRNLIYQTISSDIQEFSFQAQQWNVIKKCKLHSNKHNTRWKNYLWRKEHCSKLGHWDSSMEVFAEEELSGQITLWKAFILWKPLWSKVIKKQKHIQCLECICFQMRIHLVSVQMLQNDHQMTLLRYLLNISKFETNLCEVCVVLQRNWFCWKANLPRHWLETLDQIETAQRHMRQIQILETFKITSTDINVKKITNTWFSHL